MNLSIKGIVIRETDFSENNKYIELLTYDYGKISILCKGVRKKNSPLANKTRLFNFGDFEVFENRNTYILNDVNLIERFFDISQNIDHFALCSYFVQVCDKLCDQDSIDINITRVLISALYAVIHKKDIALVKSALELRLMSIVGYTPQLDRCSICQEKSELISISFDVLNGGLCCLNCLNKTDLNINTIPINKGIVYAMHHIVTADIKKLYSFTVDEKSFEILTNLTEKYLLTQTDYKFKTLEFYKSLGGLS